MAYQIAQSLRFRSGNSNYASLTPAAGTQDKWKIVWRGKRGTLGAQQCLISAASTSDDQIYFNSSDKLCWDFAGTNRLVSTMVFRDPAAWITLEIIYDAANGTAAQKARVFVSEGGKPLVEITSWDTDTRSSITTGTSKINTNVVHNIGRRANGVTNYFDGLMTDLALIDNSATTAFSGATDSTTGVFVPSAPASPKWWLKFADNSSVANLGTDSGSDAAAWTMTNFSVTVGATYDSFVDTPTNYGTDTGAGGEVRGNYATWSPTDHVASGIAPTDGNLSQNCNQPAWSLAKTTFGIPDNSGFWQWEMVQSGTANGANAFGVMLDTVQASVTGAPNGRTGCSGLDNASGAFINGSVSGSITYPSVGGVITCLYDATNHTLQVFSNGTSQGTITGLPAGTVFPFVAASSTNGSPTFVANFGQRVFSYNKGGKALCTQNLSNPTIPKPSSHFDILTWAGDGNASRSITGLGFQPDFAWLKCRTDAISNTLFDSARGVGKTLYSDATAAEATNDTGGYVSSFDNAGITVAKGSISVSYTNLSAKNYVGWLFKAGGAGASNADGTITSTVSANQNSGFSIVKWTGTGANGTLGHGLGVAPRFIITANRASPAWQVQHASLGGTKYLLLQSSAGEGTSALPWNNTAPTSTVISLGSGNSNDSAANMIAWCFAEVAGFSKFGSYTGNGSTDGPFVWCGFRPRWIIIKRTDVANDWGIFDTARGTYNMFTNELYADLANAEGVTGGLDILSNGFKCRLVTSAAYINASGGTYIYAAFADIPFKYSAAPAETFSVLDYASTQMFCLP